MANTVKVKSYANVHLEKVATAAITPGMLIELISTDKFQKHAVDSGAVVPIMFAIEDSYQGNAKTVDYAAADQVIGWIPGRGDVVEAIMEGDSTVTLVIGDKLRSAGNGNLEKFSEVSDDTGMESGAGEIVGVLLQAGEGGDRLNVLIS